ncbi:AI-2E family transporter [Enterovirga rhinocerotis]|uniref:Putative PurR-regulated permease PerM n=1 Tax=Enterovirga rhinocerotis TaxID=1339210 RepID=A0A4R7C922_9HYPH|nr:AI-2E family transporter [Enterovirga rhinocerotis]TDR94901.1 putative PurR-regulated permease PerM [Enterovirga rhinocerotis]
MQRQVPFWLGLLVATGLVLYLLGDILLPFVAGMAIAYLLDPLADRLERLGVSRLGATIVILILFVVVVVLALGAFLPLAARQVVTFAEQFPSYVERLQRLVAEQGQPLIERFGGHDAMAQLQQSIGNLVGQGAAWVAGFARSLWTGGKALLNVVSILVVTPVVAFYMLVDWDRMISTIDRWVPPRHRETVRGLGRDMDRAVAGFVRGQTAVCILLGVFYATGLSLIGLNFGATIGMLAGLISFIPYVGSLVGLLLSVGVALVQFLPDWTWVLATLAVFMVGQFIEGNILSPKLVGASVGLHPVWLMFALLAFGSLFGFTGLLVAVPLAAMIGVLGRFAIRRYQESPMFLGPPEETEEFAKPAAPPAIPLVKRPQQGA